jgi:hypothetical protein
MKWYRQFLSFAIADLMNSIQSCATSLRWGSSSGEYVQQQQPLHNQSHQPRQRKSPRQKTLGCDEVAHLFREPFMLTGYREPYKSWTYYVASLFHVHNEGFNVWTHLVAFFLFLYKVIRQICHRCVLKLREISYLNR